MKRTPLIIALLILVFAAPGIGAYLVYKHPEWIKTTTNHGRLLQPPQKLTALSHHPKWQLLYWMPKDCDKTCAQQLNKLARIRLALGRRLYQVEIQLLLPVDAAPLQPALETQMQTEDSHTLRVHSSMDMSTLGTNPSIYIADPKHFLIITYDSSQSSDDMFQDLKKVVTDK